MTAATELKKQEQQSDTKIYITSTGYRVNLHPVGSTIIDEVQAAIPRPKPPVVHLAEKGRNEENPLDPDYLQAVQEYEHKIGFASIEALLVFGVELIDSMPEDDTWIKRLQFMAKRHGIDSYLQYDLDDPLEREIAFIRYVVVGIADLKAIGSRAGVTREAVEKAAATFQS